MDHSKNRIGGPDDLTWQVDGTTPTGDIARPQRGPVPALALTGSQPFSMDRVERFFDSAAMPQGNALVGEMVDENGPPAGRESPRGKRKPGTLPMQFVDDDRPMLFAPNDAPDELPERQTELDRLLRQQEFRERRRFTA